MRGSGREGGSGREEEGEGMRERRMGLTNGQQPVLLPQERRLLRREPAWGSYACNGIIATSLGTVTDLDYGLGLLFST